MPQNKNPHFIKGLVKKAGDEEGILQQAVASSNVVDRKGEVVDQDGIDLKNFKKNPVLLWSHNASLSENRPPIGKVLKTWFEGARKKKLMFSVQFDMEDDFARLIYNKYKKGYLKAFSIGFIPIEREDETYIKSELLEISAVPVPANPEALVHLKDIKNDKMLPATWKDFFEKEKEEEGKVLGEDKKAVPYSATPTFPEGKSWDASSAKVRIRKWASSDGSGDKDKIDWGKYRKAFAFYDPSDSENFGAYKLPHHDVDGETLKTVWRGVAAAMAALLGARGGVNIPSGDRKGVYNHLKKHYGQYDKEPPKFRSLEDMLETIAAITYKEVVVDKGDVEEAVKRALKKRKKKIARGDEKDILPEFQDSLKILVTIANLALKKINEQKKGVRNNE